jgi:hypothetical protein
MWIQLNSNVRKKMAASLPGDFPSVGKLSPYFAPQATLNWRRFAMVGTPPAPPHPSGLRPGRPAYVPSIRHGKTRLRYASQKARLGKGRSDFEFNSVGSTRMALYLNGVMAFSPMFPCRRNSYAGWPIPVAINADGVASSQGVIFRRQIPRKRRSAGRNGLNLRTKRQLKISFWQLMWLETTINYD